MQVIASLLPYKNGAAQIKTVSVGHGNYVQMVEENEFPAFR